MQIVNERLYHDRTVQDWHRCELPNDWWAIDLDLMGACRKCRQPLYLIEATTVTRNKPTTILRALAERSNLAAFVVYHDEQQVTGGRMIWPRCADLQSELMVRIFLAHIRNEHNNQAHPAPTTERKPAWPTRSP